ncbi:MAG: M3 family oligoendopeptidase [Anaerolineales bacterium]|nr:M3 family oligoendopeptidase [Anaerolineales bacterium]
MNNKYSLETWDLNDLFPAINSGDVEKALNKLDQLTDEFSTQRDKLNDKVTGQKLIDILGLLETLTRKAYRLYQFANLKFSENSQDQEAATFYGKITQKMAEMENQTMFFSLWWKALDEQSAQKLLGESGEYRYYLQQIRNYQPHTLKESEEQIINLKDVTGKNALVTIYSSLTNRYMYKIVVGGEEKEMTRGELMTLVQKSDPDLRAAAYQELYRVFGEDGNILGKIYQALVRDFANENMNLRKYEEPISVRNLTNDIPDEVVNTLLDVCEENSQVFQRFFKLKAELLGMDKLRRYDIYAPLSKSEKTYDFDYAVRLTLDAYKDFDPEIADLAKRIFDKKHIDSVVHKGKDTGAFCSYGDPSLTPYVLVNFNGSARDISTLAHELGHAIHGMLAEHHNVFNYSSNLPLAETASTFGEMLLVDRLLAEETDEDVKRDILFSQVDDAYATILRQAFFTLFERKAHKMIVEEGASVDELTQAYMKNLETQFGDSVVLSDEFKWEWVSIPHIYHYPFYVYAYAFGQLLVLALYKRYQEEGDSFIPKYKELLSAGGSMAPDEVLKRAGVDMKDAAFWQGGFEVIREMITKLEKAAGK